MAVSRITKKTSLGRDYQAIEVSMLGMKSRIMGYQGNSTMRSIFTAYLVKACDERTLTFKQKNGLIAEMESGHFRFEIRFHKGGGTSLKWYDRMMPGGYLLLALRVSEVANV